MDHDRRQEVVSAVALAVARLCAVVAAVTAPVLYLHLVVRVADRLVGAGTDHPLLIVLAVVAGSVAVLGALVVLTRRPLAMAWRRLQLDEVVPRPARSIAEVVRDRRVPSRRSLALGVGEIAAYAGVVLALFWPLGRLADGIRAVPVDGEGWAWLGWRMGREMARGIPFPTVLQGAMHPYDIDLLGGDGYMTAWVAGVLNLVSEPRLAYNLTQVVAVVLALVAGRHLARTCTADRVAVMVATAAFAASPLILARFIGHQNLIFVFPSALVLAEVVRTLRSEFTEVRWIRLAAWLVLAYLSSVYYLLFGLLVLAVAVVHCMVRRRADSTWWTSLGRIALAVAVTLVCMSPFLATRFARDGAEREAGAPVELDDVDRTLPYSADLYSALAPPPDSRNPLLRFASTPRDLETTAYPGVLLLLGLGSVVIVRSRARLTIAVSGLSLWLLTLGPTLVVFRSVDGALAKVPAIDGVAAAWLPYALLLEVPGLSSLRTPVRSGFWLVPLGAAGLALVLGAVLRGRPPLLKASVAAVGLLLVVGDMATATPFIPASPSPAIVEAFDRIARDPSERSVVVVPDDCLKTWGTAVFEIEHEHPVVGCTWYSSSVRWYSGLDDYTGSEAWSSLRCAPDVLGPRPLELEPGEGAPDAQDLAQLTDELDVGWVVLQKQPTQCNPARFAAIDALLRSHAELLAEDGEYAVFALDER
ncbi:MAG: hypothetical protein V9E94_08740 [Microthrixaceae bacterium]